MKLVYGVDACESPVYYVVPENLLHPKRRSLFISKGREEGEIYGFPMRPVRGFNGAYTGDYGLEVPAATTLDDLLVIGSIMDYFASALTEYPN